MPRNPALRLYAALQVSKKQHKLNKTITVIVITSYSIHYTKLYDLKFFLLMPNILEISSGAVLSLAGRKLPASFNLSSTPWARITSYNVCYTKLLREILDESALLELLSDPPAT